MPLNPIIKPKLNEWLNGIKDAVKNGDIMTVSSRSSSISSAGDIFTDDLEWSGELFTSGLLLGYLSYIMRDWDEKSEEKKKGIIETVCKYLDITRTAVEKENWLDYHKSIREMLYALNKIT